MFFVADGVIITNAYMFESTVALRVSIQDSPGDMIQRAGRGLYGLEIGRPYIFCSMTISTLSSPCHCCQITAYTW